MKEKEKEREEQESGTVELSSTQAKENMRIAQGGTVIEGLKQLLSGNSSLSLSFTGTQILKMLLLDYFFKFSR